MPRFTQPSQIEPYLKDASQFQGKADGVFIPEDEKEIVEFLKEANAKKIPVTVSAGRTGLTGASVPESGWVLSIEKLSHIGEEIEVVRPEKSLLHAYIKAGPAVYRKDLNLHAAKKGFFFPPDPTGPNALLGGMVATDASGPNSFKYTSTRSFIHALRVVLANGEILELERNRDVANNDNILELRTRKGILKVPIPRYTWPSIKHTGGYYSTAPLSAVDLFAGSEGTLGVITEIFVRVLPNPPELLSFIVFFKREEDAWQFSKRTARMSIRNRSFAGEGSLETRILEYFDSASLDFLRPSFPRIPKEARALLFLEQEIKIPGLTRSLIDEWQAYFKKEGAMDEVWMGDALEKQEEFRSFRSALPLAVRDFLAKHRQRKVGTDTCVPPEKFDELMLFHRQKVQELGIQNVTFGHIGENHVHLNLLPRNDKEAEQARALYPELLEKAIQLGGTFSAEHGVGKLKKPYLARFFGEEAIQNMREIKRILDPNLILGQGNLFEIQ